MSLPSDQAIDLHARAVTWLNTASTLRPADRHALASLTLDLAQGLRQGLNRCLCISGPPGSGKTTLSRLLAFLLEPAGKSVSLLSLDDYYLNQAARQELAASVHPLLARRGPPGTHNWAQLLSDIDSLLDQRYDLLLTPVFNKSTDDVEPRSRWREVHGKPHFIILEGWCLGAPGQSAAELVDPVNATEMELDSNEYWRRYVNDMAGQYHTELRARFDQFWFLGVPGWERVVDWRWQQERELAQPRLHNRSQVQDFLAVFERIGRHMLSGADAWADVCLIANESHRIEVIQ